MVERARVSVVIAVLLLAGRLFAQHETPGYPERVLQWTVKNGETCDDISEALYGSIRHRALLERYNVIRCVSGTPLADGMTLVVPEKPTALATARLRSMHPEVRARSPGGAWEPAAPGIPLYEKHSVNTLENAHADILFADRSRIVLGEHTLVVIYDAAKRTVVTRTVPTVVLETGEVEAGLAALRGRPFELDTQNGQVTGTSKSLAVRSKAQRATVSVFEGNAKVSSAGTGVDVPKNFGTSFRRSAPPSPPRPLPAAPLWTATTSAGVVLAEPGASVLVLAWSDVPNSSAYRVEVARDAEFSDLILREEVAADVHTLRAEKFPPGAYYARVRTIDDEDFLGIASAPRAFVLVEARVSGGNVHADSIELSRYGNLRFTSVDELEVSFDGGRFSRAPALLDPLRFAPKEIALRVRGVNGIRRYAVRYRPVSAKIETARQAASLAVAVRFEGLHDIDIPKRVRPSLWVTTSSGSRKRYAFDENWIASIPEKSPRFLHVVDGRANVLGERDLSGATADVTDSTLLGATAPLISPSALDDVEWWAPTRANAVTASAVGYLKDDRSGAQIGVRGSGSFGPFGLDARVMTPELRGPVADGSAWFRLRWRTLDSDDAGIELGPAAELGIPLTTTSPPSRAGLGLAIGGPLEHASWLLDVGGRALLSESAERQAAPDVQGYALFGSSYDELGWLRVYALIDAHLLDHPDRDELAFRGGLSAGGELGRRAFVGAALRASPWDDAGGTLIGQLSAGIRDR